MAGDDNTTEITVIEELVTESVTLTADGMADVLYKRTLTDTTTGEIVVSDVVRETVPIDEVLIDLYVNAVKAAGSMKDGSAKAKVTKQQLCKG